MGINLKSCPFCGGVPVTQVTVLNGAGKYSTMGFIVKCSRCEVYMEKILDLSDSNFDYVFSTMFNAVDDWNTRCEGNNIANYNKENYSTLKGIEDALHDLNDLSDLNHYL